MRRSLDYSNTPGPGKYQSNDTSIIKKLPSWSLSKSSRDSLPKSISLGPGQYQYDKNYKIVVTSTPSFGFGSDKKLKTLIDAVPGPGSYQKSEFISHKNGKIGQRLKDMTQSIVPGPGSYQYSRYDMDSWKKGGGKYSLGNNARLQVYLNQVPGPGSYQHNLDNPHKCKIAFGKDRKLKVIKNETPGPGQYNLKPFFADVPKYLLPEKGN